MNNISNVIFIFSDDLNLLPGLSQKRLSDNSAPVTLIPRFNSTGPAADRSIRLIFDETLQKGLGEVKYLEEGGTQWTHADNKL